MNTKLLTFLIESFTKQGDVILDPMCGSGSTGVVAALHGRNAVQIDIEEKFIKWAEEAKAKVERQAVFSKKGKITNVCGDARRLSELLKEVDVVLTSPPYAETISSSAGGKCTLKRVGISTRNYSEKKENIGNLPLGKVDAVITSPPFSGNTTNKRDSDEKLRPHRSYRLCGVHGDAKEQIGNLPHGNAVISKLPFDAVITSPPYEDAMSGKRHTLNTERQRKIFAEKRWTTRYGDGKNLPAGFSEYQENIGDLKKETYLEAMQKVYGEMWRVLKLGGLCIIVIKPFIRNKQVVDLPYQTWLFLDKVGFKLVKLFKLRLEQETFWRVLYRKKYPYVPTIRHEYILVCQKT